MIFKTNKKNNSQTEVKDYFEIDELSKYNFVNLTTKGKKQMLKKARDAYKNVEYIHPDDLNPMLFYHESIMPDVEAPVELEVNVAEKWKDAKNWKNAKYKVEIRGYGKYATNIPIASKLRNIITLERDHDAWVAETKELNPADEYCVYEFIGKAGVPNTLGIVTWKRKFNEPSRKKIPEVTLDDVVLLESPKEEKTVDKNKNRFMVD